MNIQSSTSRQAVNYAKTERAQSEPAEATLKQENDSFVPGAAAEQFVSVGGRRWMVSPEQLADVEFHYIDGSSVSVPDGKAVADQLAKTKDGTLDWFKPSGHGSDNRFGASMGFDVNDEGAPGLTTMKGSKTPRLMMDVSDGNHTKQVDLGKLMEHKWAPGGQRLFIMDACDTGDANGLAPTGARVLPGVRFQGVSGTLLENRLTGQEQAAAGPDAIRQFVIPRSQAGQLPGAHNAFPVRK